MLIAKTTVILDIMKERESRWGCAKIEITLEAAKFWDIYSLHYHFLGRPRDS